ncbi:hypothetical protein [Bradyrhizobium iriomotense]|uniref:Lycopene cyclase domain-containing protein n=1 Tax=Bradyrhizobium iriomotense TaxID=441950 RepID=A0ABQ6AN55_9BRAD|nr:hypothetical protein [Bradyrhizobium iriomotense]GLR83677.1 hypothetical protein GCM10007857_03870 [Bradyrhizobium iriomotense]
MDWYFVLAVAGPPFGFLFVIGAIPFLIYSCRTSNAPRSLIASRIALILSLASVLVSIPLWISLLTGHHRNGAPVDYYDHDFALFEVIAVFEALALLTAVLSAMRQRARPAPPRQ